MVPSYGSNDPAARLRIRRSDEAGVGDWNSPPHVWVELSFQVRGRCPLAILKAIDGMCQNG